MAMQRRSTSAIKSPRKKNPTSRPVACSNTCTISKSGYGRDTSPPSTDPTGPAATEAFPNPAARSASTMGLARPCGRIVWRRSATVGPGASVISPVTRITISTASPSPSLRPEAGPSRITEAGSSPSRRVLDAVQTCTWRLGTERAGARRCAILSASVLFVPATRPFQEIPAVLKSADSCSGLLTFTHTWANGLASCTAIGAHLSSSPAPLLESSASNRTVIGSSSRVT
mmetsp:Transcript_45936/g.109599  ORF Transcript_45936/g.109599 Transcript_45936/m.109599 type:complete len:229 (+) Transcript_45936:283-969(+)